MGVSMVNEVWHRRRVLVTGCTGLLGAWLTDWLAAQHADVVGLVRDYVPASNFHRLGLAKRVTTVRGSIEDLELMAGVLNEYEIEVVFSSRGTAHRRHCERRSGVDLDDEHHRDVDGARGGEADVERSGDRDGLERQDLWHPRRAAILRDRAAHRTPSLRCLEKLRRSHRTDVGTPTKCRWRLPAAGIVMAAAI